MQLGTQKRPQALVSCKYLLWQGKSQRVSIKFICWAVKGDFSHTTNTSTPGAFFKRDNTLLQVKKHISVLPSLDFMGKKIHIML